MNLYDVLKKPKLTEKSGLLKEEFNQFVFEVDPKANKVQIKESVEKAFKVEVIKVRTMNVSGKKKRLGRHQGRKSSWKKAQSLVCVALRRETIPRVRELPLSY